MEFLILQAHAGSAIGIAQIADAHGDQMVEVRATKAGDLNLDGQVSISGLPPVGIQLWRTGALAGR